MANLRICEVGSVAQSDFVLGVSTIAGGGLDSVKFAAGVLVSNDVPPVTDTHATQQEGQAVENVAANPSEGHDSDNGTSGQGAVADGNHSRSEELFITNS